MWRFFSGSGLLVVLAVVWVREWSATRLLERQVELLRHEDGSAGRLRAERARLEEGSVAPEEMERLRSGRHEAGFLRGKLKEMAEASAREAKAVSPERAVTEIAAAVDAGRATAAAAFETMVWAARQGDVDTMAGLLAFGPEARRELDGIFARLPEAARVEYGTAEKVFATLLVTQLPHWVKGVEAPDAGATGANEEVVRLRLGGKGGETQERSFRFGRDAQGWRLMVPAGVVKGYETLITGKLRRMDTGVGGRR